MGSLLERAGETQYLVCRLMWRGFDSNESRTTHCQCAGFVEHHGMSSRQSFNRRTAFDENAATRRTGDTCNEGDWSRQNERTRS